MCEVHAATVSTTLHLRSITCICGSLALAVDASRMKMAAFTGLHSAALPKACSSVVMLRSLLRPSGLGTSNLARLVRGYAAEPGAAAASTDGYVSQVRGTS